MAITFNQSAVAVEPAGPGVLRQRLLMDERIPGTNVVLEHLTLQANATIFLEPSATSVIWFHLLQGEAKLDTLWTNEMSSTHSAFLPPAFSGSLSTAKGASLLYVEVEDRGEGDLPRLGVVNWVREPVFKSERDARKRVALVTDDICSTTAIRIEMVIYPPGSRSANHSQEGAVSFLFVLSGRGKATANEQEFWLQEGDLIYFQDMEKRSLEAVGESDFRFLAFYVPGKFKTVWAEPKSASAWRSTGLDINGYQTLKDLKDSRNNRGGGAT